jgi:type IV pilus assembly protein PilQ
MRLISEISDLNLIVSEDVQGNISLRLQDVPWDQALDLILEIQELGMIKKGNVARVLPLKKIQEMETERLRAKQEVKRLEETVTEIFAINYKDAESFEGVIDDILSDQGEVQVIEGSKKIMVNDIPSKLDEIRTVLKELDEPIKQVMIEARIVEANTRAGQSLGINWGFSYSNDEAGNIGIENIDTADIGLGGAFTLPSPSAAPGLGAELIFGRLGIDDKVLSLKLAALENSGKGRVISSPKVLALDGETARIAQGEDIPYQAVDDSGNPDTQFKKAELSLEVTSYVNPDNTLLLEISASNSSRGDNTDNGPAINTKDAETKLLLENGETTVIGGIYTENEQKNESGTPFLKEIPYIGNLFKHRVTSKDRTELLIFITPRIVE